MLKAFPSLTTTPPNSGNYWVGKYSIHFVSMTVSLLVVTYRVSMDTSFCPDDRFPTPQTMHHQLLSSSIVDEFNVKFWFSVKFMEQLIA